MQPRLPAIARTLALVLLVAAGSACQPAGDPDAGVDGSAETIDLAHLAEHTCTHFQTGTPIAVTASAARDASAAQVAIAHTLHAVSLVPFEGEQGGYLRLRSGEAAHVALFMGKDLPIVVEDLAGVAQTVHDQLLQPASCSAIQKVLLLELAAATYFVKLGPTAETALDLVAEHAEHEHE